MLRKACLCLLIAAVSAPARAEMPVFEPVEEGIVRAVTSLAASRDGTTLFAVTLRGELLRWPIDRETGALGPSETLELAHFQSATGPRGLVGLAVDPEDPLTLWVTDNDPVPLSGKDPTIADLSGRVSRIRLEPGDGLRGSAETYIRGLPRSCADHLTNSLVFGENPDRSPGAPRHLLYLSQGSVTSMGDMDPNWCMRPERLLSAAILEIDPRRTPPEGGFDVTTEPLPVDGEFRRFGYTRIFGRFAFPTDDGDLKNDGIVIDDGPFRGSFLHFDARGVATVRSGGDIDSPVLHRFYDPFAEDAVVRLFATGLRNVYDFVVRPDGFLIAAANGTSGNARTPDDPRTPVNEALSKVGRQHDLIYALRRGDYGGHPNPLRDEFVAFGGNPTEGEDPHEVENYPVGVVPHPRFAADRVHQLGHHWAPTGMIAYSGATGHPGTAGTVIFANYSRGNNLRAMRFDEDGRVVADDFIRTPGGTEFESADPIDLAMGGGGRIYVATLPRSNGVGKLFRLDPVVRGRVQVDVINASDPSAVIFVLRGIDEPGFAEVQISFDGGVTRQTVRTDKDGRFTLPVGRVGETVVATVRVGSAPDQPQAIFVPGG